MAQSLSSSFLKFLILYFFLRDWVVTNEIYFYSWILLITNMTNSLTGYLYVEHSFGLFLFNIFIYLFLATTVVLILFLFDLRLFKSLNELKNIGHLNFITLVFVITLLSMAGLPPLAGFIGKFLLIMFIFLKKQYALALFLVIFNFFALYFYLQNIRFLIRKHKSKTPYIFRKNYVYWNIPFISWITLFSFFNLTSLFFVEDALILFENSASYLFIE